MMETRNYKHYETLEFKRNLAVTFSKCDRDGDDRNALWTFSEVGNARGTLLSYVTSYLPHSSPNLPIRVRV
jgi:hypothetical protein